MFNGCTSLTTTQSTLPATGVSHSGYSYMFANCVSLQAAPDLMVMSGVNWALYAMFSSCVTLTATSSLNIASAYNSTLGSMYAHCTALTSTFSSLPLKHIAGTYQCQYMFSGCTSLTVAPDLPLETINNGSYAYMFQGCSNLNSVKCLAVNVGAQSTYFWLSGVASSGTFTKSPNKTWERSVHGIPTGWTVVDATV
jgi:hypothetical protein